MRRGMQRPRCRHSHGPSGAVVSSHIALLVVVRFGCTATISIRGCGRVQQWSDMKLSDHLPGLGRPVLHFGNLSIFLRSPKAAIFLGQLAFWFGRQHDPDGWIYKTQRAWTEETGLSRQEQETARRIVRDRGYLREKYGDIPRKLFYQIQWDTLVADFTLHSRVGRGSNSETETETDAETETPSTASAIGTWGNFASFWSRYPRHEQKHAARQLWQKMNLETDAQLYRAVMDGLTRHMKVWSDEGREARYIVQAVKFLKERQWEDEPRVDHRPKLTEDSRMMLDATERFLERHRKQREDVNNSRAVVRRL